MTPPEVTEFADGFGWKAVAGAIFLGFIVKPASDYLGLVVGPAAGISDAMKWVMIIFFAEVAKRSFTSLKTQELYVLHFMAGAALAAPFGGLLWKQYVAQSEYVQGLGLAAELPRWAFPSAEQVQAAGHTFFAEAWIPIIVLVLFGQILSRLDNYGLGYVLYRVTSDVEKLPFPFAPVGAAGIVALSTDRGEETTWRWRCFAIGGVLGITWGAIYICVPMITQVILPKRVELIPLIFIDLTEQVSQYLPAVAFNLVINFGAFLSGMIVPFWGVMGGFIGLVITMAANPILYKMGVLSTWRPDMGFIDTTFVNNLDFYMSFTMGLTLAVTFSQFFIFIATSARGMMKPKAHDLSHTTPFGQRMKDGWRLLVTNNKARGDFSIFIALAFYCITTSSWILLGYYLVPGYPWMIMVFYGVIYTPLISYATAKLEGICGRAVNLPYLYELTILLTGHKGVDIWFAPMPIRNMGAETVGFRVLELTGTKIVSQLKTILLTLPIVVVSSFVTAELLWRMADVPSGAYPWTERMWELQLRGWCLMKTATLEGGSQMLEALHFEYAVWGFTSGGILFGVLSALGLPIMLVFGAVWGLMQSTPGVMFCTMAGAFVGKFYFKRKYKDMWLKYMTAILAGFGCGVGLSSMVAMAFNVISRMLSPTPW